MPQLNDLCTLCDCACIRWVVAQMIYEPCPVCSMSQFLWLANDKRATDGSSALFFVFSFTLEVPLWMCAHLRFIFGAFDGDLVYGLDDGNGELIYELCHMCAHI